MWRPGGAAVRPCRHHLTAATARPAGRRAGKARTGTLLRLLRACQDANVEPLDAADPAIVRIATAIHAFEGTETMRTLIFGRDITGIGAFT